MSTPTSLRDNSHSLDISISTELPPNVLLGELGVQIAHMQTTRMFLQVKSYRSNPDQTKRTFDSVREIRDLLTNEKHLVVFGDTRNREKLWILFVETKKAGKMISYKNKNILSVKTRPLRLHFLNYLEYYSLIPLT